MSKEKKYLKDNVAGIIFNSSDCIEYVESIVSAAIGVDKKEIAGNLTLMTPRISENINIKNSNADAIYENNTSIINIEINYHKSKTTNMKNLRYVCQLLLKQTRPNEKIDLKPIIQININNYDVFNKQKFIYRSYIMESELHQKRDDTISIIDINVDLLSEIDYNNIKGGKDSLEYLLYIFVNNNERVLTKLYSSDIIMKKVQERMSALSSDFLDGLYYDHEEFNKQAAYDEAYEKGIEEGIEAGIEQGEKAKALEIAKNLLKLNIKNEDIIKATGLKIAELQIIKKELDEGNI